MTLIYWLWNLNWTDSKQLKIVQYENKWIASYNKCVFVCVRVCKTALRMKDKWQKLCSFFIVEHWEVRSSERIAPNHTNTQYRHKGHFEAKFSFHGLRKGEMTLSQRETLTSTYSKIKVLFIVLCSSYEQSTSKKKTIRYRKSHNSTQPEKVAATSNSHSSKFIQFEQNLQLYDWENPAQCLFLLPNPLLPCNAVVVHALSLAHSIYSTEMKNCWTYYVCVCVWF